MTQHNPERRRNVRHVAAATRQGRAISERAFWTVFLSHAMATGPTFLFRQLIGDCEDRRIFSSALILTVMSQLYCLLPPRVHEPPTQSPTHTLYSVSLTPLFISVASQ